MKNLPAAAFALSIFLPILAAADPPAAFDFSDGYLPGSWQGVKGEWKAVDGALFGAELESDRHAAVLSIPDPHADSTISFRFRLDGAKALHLSYNHPKGHLFRISVVSGEVALRLDKDKKDPASKPELLARGVLEAKPGEWVELRCKVVGETAEVQCGGLSLAATHPKLAMPKTGYRFVVAGASVGIDEVAYTSSK